MKIGLISLGCDKNRCDSELMLSYLVKGDYELTNDETEAEVIIVNTCAFIESAREESINTILEVAEHKKTGRLKKLIVTGCLAQKYVDEIFDDLPEVDAFLGVKDYPLICDVLADCMNENKRINAVNTCDKLPSFQRYLTTPFDYAYLMIADGCNNHCTYCTIPQIRGKYRSKPLDDLIAEASMLAAEDVKEIILVAQDVTSYGLDLYGKLELPALIDKISKIEGIERIRLLYCYPEKVTDELIETIKNNDKVVKYIDIPLQHASTPVLKRMGRMGTFEDYVALFNKLKTEIPDIAIRSTVMVGFPGETEEDFKTLVDFVRLVKPVNCGAFMYSDEEDAPSNKLPDKVPEKIKKARYKKLLKVLSEVSSEEKRKLIGKTLPVAYEDIDYDNNRFIGRSYISAPDIDSLVYFTSDIPVNFGETVNVYIEKLENDDFVGVRK